MAIETAMGGHTTADAWAALVDAFGNLIAFAAEDRAHAEQLLQLSVADLRQSINEGWDDCRLARARSNSAGRA